MTRYRLEMGIAATDIVADSDGHAQAAAQALATVLQRPVAYEKHGDATTRAIYSPGAANSTVNNAGQGISY